MTNQATHPVTLISHIFVLPGKVGVQKLKENLTRLVWCTQQLHSSVHWVFVKKIALKSIHWVNSSTQGSCFYKMKLMSALARLERFGENEPFLKKWRSCRTVYSMNNFEWCLGFWSTKLISDVTKIDFQFRTSKS